MKTVFKYRIEDGQLSLPSGAKFLKFDIQDEEFRAWFEIDPEEGNIKKRLFRVFRTGEKISEDYHWLGTCLEGALVWHLYEAIL